MSSVRISLVLATKDRDISLINFLDHLKPQTFDNFEILIIDQNLDDRIQKILTHYPEFNIIHIKSEPGLSHARNMGLEQASGDIIGFPDDDCWYDADTLSYVIKFFSNHPAIDGLTGRTLSGTNQKPIWKWDNKKGLVNKKNIWKRASSVSIFVRSDSLKLGINFDEKLGVGSGTPWGSGEEIDFLLQMLQAGFTIEYDPDFIVYHDDAIPNNNEKEIKKAYTYACGMGYVLRKHNYSLWLILNYLSKPFLSSIRAIIMGKNYKAKFTWAMFTGRLIGLRK